MRLDEYLATEKYFDSRTKAKQAIERGEVYVNGKVSDKPSATVSPDNISVEIRSEKEFVSLGGYKLDKALSDFNFDVKNRVCADFGASTGGFTDCLLQRGAKTVYAIDLNDGLLHEKLKNDSRVIPVIRNAKDVTIKDFAVKPSLITADLSFISQTAVIPIFADLLSDGEFLIVLIKPQFEYGEKRRFKNGIIRDDKIRKQICLNIVNFAGEHGFVVKGFTDAPRNADKNVEFLVLFEKNGERTFDFDSERFSSLFR